MVDQQELRVAIYDFVNECKSHESKIGTFNCRACRYSDVCNELDVTGLKFPADWMKSWEDGAR